LPSNRKLLQATVVLCLSAEVLTAGVRIASSTVPLLRLTIRSLILATTVPLSSLTTAPIALLARI
jgi:hypothetical protein